MEDDKESNDLRGDGWECPRKPLSENEETWHCLGKRCFLVGHVAKLYSREVGLWNVTVVVTKDAGWKPRCKFWKVETTEEPRKAVWLPSEVITKSVGNQMFVLDKRDDLRRQLEKSGRIKEILQRVNERRNVNERRRSNASKGFSLGSIAEVLEGSFTPFANIAEVIEATFIPSSDVGASFT